QNFRSFYINANRIYDDDPKISTEHLWLGRLAVCDFTNYRVLEKMQLYERRLENSLHKTRAELEKLQAARKAEQKAREKSAPADDQVNLKKQSQSPSRGGKAESGPPRNRADDLKKQSQFAAGHIDTSPCGDMGYDEVLHADSAANEAGQACPEHGRGGQFDEPGSATGVGQTSGGRA
ncbi:MAG: hypothetical protein ACYSWO_16185, partial [Planctomycetota bacterium]